MKSGIADKLSSKKTRSFLTDFLLKKFWFFLHEIVYSWIRSTGKEYESVYGVIDNQETKERISYFFSLNLFHLNIFKLRTKIFHHVETRMIILTNPFAATILRDKFSLPYPLQDRSIYNRG